MEKATKAWHRRGNQKHDKIKNSKLFVHAAQGSHALSYAWLCVESMPLHEPVAPRGVAVTGVAVSDAVRHRAALCRGLWCAVSSARGRGFAVFMHMCGCTIAGETTLSQETLRRA